MNGSTGYIVSQGFKVGVGLAGGINAQDIVDAVSYCLNPLFMTAV